MAVVWLLFLRRKMVCRGLMSGLKAYDVHLIQVCGWCKCVRLLCVDAISGLWRTCLRFEYMRSTWPTAGKYGNYRGFL